MPNMIFLLRKKNCLFLNNKKKVYPEENSLLNILAFERTRSSISKVSCFSKKKRLKFSFKIEGFKTKAAFFQKSRKYANTYNISVLIKTDSVLKLLM